MYGLAGKRIFIIEDNPNNFAITKTLLERHGAEVWFDRYGDHVLERLENFAPVDLILLDLMFPDGITGYDLYDLIRSVPTLAEVPIVAVSASDPSEAIPKTRNQGFAGFIAKPVSYELFVKQVMEILENKETWVER